MVGGELKQVLVRDYLDKELKNSKDWATSYKSVKGLFGNQKSFETAKGMGVGRTTILKFKPGRIITESVELVSLPRPKSFWHFYQNEYRPTGSFLRKAIYDIGQQFWPYCFLWQLKRLIEISSAGSLKF